MSRYLLLTGAAGLVGQYLLGDLLGKSIPTAVLMRARNGKRLRPGSRKSWHGSKRTWAGNCQGRCA